MLLTRLLFFPLSRQVHQGYVLRARESSEDQHLGQLRHSITSECTRAACRPEEEEDTLTRTLRRT